MVKNLKISEKTHKRLCEFGNKGETFDEIINRLLEKNDERKYHKRNK